MIQGLLLGLLMMLLLLRLLLLLMLWSRNDLFLIAQVQNHNF